MVERKASITGLWPIKLHALSRLLGDLPARFEQLLALLRVFQRDGGMRGQFGQRGLVLVAEVSFQLVDRFETRPESLPRDVRIGTHSSVRVR